MTTVNFPTAYYPNESYNQSSWILEKAHNTIWYLCNIIDSHCISDDGVITHLFSAIDDAMKIYTFFSGLRDIMNSEDRYLPTLGTDGFKRLKYLYGLSYEIDEVSKKDKDKETESIIVSLIGNEKTNRTIIHEKIHELYYKSDFIKNLENDLYKVTMGEKPWDWFTDKYKDKDE